MNWAVLIISVILGLIVLFGIFANFWIIIKSSKKIKDINEKNDEVDAIMVLGCEVRKNGYPGIVLKQRLDKAIEVYKNGWSKKILVTGNHATDEYDEVNSMKNYLKSKGIPSENIFMDHAGFTTYESMYRAKYIFNVEKMVVITQKYHLYRSIYIANKLGIKTYGISAKIVKDKRIKNHTIREFFARIKNFVKCIYKPEARYMGETISIKGNGDITNDK